MERIIFGTDSHSCIDKILHIYNDKGFFETETGKIWLGRAIIEIMVHIKDKDIEVLELKNYLILLLNLSNSDIVFPDIWTFRGRNINDLKIQEKRDVLEILHSEFCLNLDNDYPERLKTCVDNGV